MGGVTDEKRESIRDVFFQRTTGRESERRDRRPSKRVGAASIRGGV